MTNPFNQKGFIIAAPTSGSGKTVVTLSLLRAFRKLGKEVSSFKVGPDYIDPGFHSAATGRPCLNIDPWGMRSEVIRNNLAIAATGAEFIIGEGVMGLFDGASDGSGSTADLAEQIGSPIILIVDARRQATSAAAVVHGFVSFRPCLNIAGVIFNRVGSLRHSKMLLDAMENQPTPVIGCIPEITELKIPERHLGLIPPEEHDELENFIETSASIIAERVDLSALFGLCISSLSILPKSLSSIPPFGQRIAVAKDLAFTFIYPHLLLGWRAAGSEILTFSPLADQPPPKANAIYLPGGYPELHAGRLSSNRKFMTGIYEAVNSNIQIYGECGGYMVLGNGLIDANGDRHQMAGLLPLETSFEIPQPHIGYRIAKLDSDTVLGKKDNYFHTHEFHYTTITQESGDQPLFFCKDANGIEMGAYGSRVGFTYGSFLHLIDQCN